MEQIIYIMGVSGSGKTTVGQLVSQKAGIPFYDADDFHSQANKEKMKAGHPLTDEDRKEWLADINKCAVSQSAINGAVISCSSLKQKYRDVLAFSIQKPIWIFLEGCFDQIYDRLKKRTGHYMPVELLASQFEILEIPADAYIISIDYTAEEIATRICNDFALI